MNNGSIKANLAVSIMMNSLPFLVDCVATAMNNISIDNNKQRLLNTWLFFPSGSEVGSCHHDYN